MARQPKWTPESQAKEITKYFAGSLFREDYRTLTKIENGLADWFTRNPVQPARDRTKKKVAEQPPSE